MTTALAERETAPANLTPAQKQKARLDQFMGAIEKRQDQIGTLLADSGIDPRLFLETCRRSLMRDPELINCDPASFIQAALNCAADGLVPDGRKADMVRHKDKVTYMPMYQGLLDVAYRTGQFQSIEAHVVYEGDEFDYDMGDAPFIRHKRPLESKSFKIIGAYAVARTTNGGIFREVMGAADLAKVRAVSRATKGPNVDWPGEMARKAPVRRLWKYLPKTPAMDRVAIHDDATYDQTAIAQTEGHGRVLRPGFNPPALTHQPAEDITPTMDAAPMDEILDGDFVPEFETVSSTAQGAGESNKLPGDEPDDAFPGDEPTDTFDPIAWAATMLRTLPDYAGVDPMREDWTAHKDELRATSPELFKQLNQAVAARAAEIGGAQ